MFCYYYYLFLCYFDVLRCDKSTSGACLEVRVPFLDLEFLEYYMNIDPDLKMCNKDKIEKYLLRSAFENIDASGRGYINKTDVRRLLCIYSDSLS